MHERTTWGLAKLGQDVVIMIISNMAAFVLLFLFQDNVFSARQVSIFLMSNFKDYPNWKLTEIHALVFL